jgi:hypothetical protein
VDDADEGGADLERDDREVAPGLCGRRDGSLGRGGIAFGRSDGSDGRSSLGDGRRDVALRRGDGSDGRSSVALGRRCGSLGRSGVALGRLSLARRRQRLVVHLFGVGPVLEVVGEIELAPIEDAAPLAREIDEQSVVGDLRDLAEDDVAWVERRALALLTRAFLLPRTVPAGSFAFLGLGRGALAPFGRTLGSLGARSGGRFARDRSVALLLATATALLLRAGRAGRTGSFGAGVLRRFLVSGGRTLVLLALVTVLVNALVSRLRAFLRACGSRGGGDMRRLRLRSRNGGRGVFSASGRLALRRVGRLTGVLIGARHGCRFWNANPEIEGWLGTEGREP